MTMIRGLLVDGFFLQHLRQRQYTMIAKTTIVTIGMIISTAISWKYISFKVYPEKKQENL